MAPLLSTPLAVQYPCGERIPDLTTTKSLYQLHRYTLPNGMRVWCVPRPNSQTVALMAQFPVGSRSEDESNNGISHFLEHMVFTGTERWDESAVTDVVRRRGGECNAQTSREETTFYLHIAAEDVEFGLDWLHQVLFKPTLSEEKFEKERQVIINEKGGEVDYLRQAWEWVEDHNLGWSVSRALRRRLFPDSSFLLPIIGSDKTLNSITHEELLAHYEAFYGPNNMTLLVVGDVEPDKIFPLVEQQFGSIPARPAPTPYPPLEVDTTPFAVRLQGPTPNAQGQLLLAWMLGASDHPDRFAWWIIAEMLENAYLQEIRYQDGLSYDTQVFTVLYTDVGYFSIYSGAKIDDLDKIRNIIEKHIKRLLAGEFTAQEVQEAQAALRGRALLNLQDNLEMASWLSSDSLCVQDDTVELADYFAELNRLNPADIQRIAQIYLSPEKRFTIEHRSALTLKNLKPLASIGAIGAVGAALLLSQRRWIQRKK